MADTQSNIQVNIDTTQALASIKNLQRQISAFHSSMAKGGAAANAVSAQMQQTLINSINSTGKFAAQIKTIKTTTESFTSSLEKNKFSLGEYFRYAGGASKTFGKLFKTEFDTINKVARENVKDLQTQYIRMGRDASGAMKAIAVRPLSLDMNDLATKTMIASEKQALLNQLLKQGSTNLLNFGKNTQWAGRQLMVGFTLPLIALGSAASKTFMDMETEAIRFKKVYGDLFTPQEESKQALQDIQDLGREFTKYGISVSSTVGLAAEAAAAGFQGVDLQRQTAAATKLSILGQVESQKALETTISLQNAFSMSSENLAESIDFLNAVENQTVLSLDDMSTAIPKAAPVVQQLGGDVKDLAFLMTAMKEGGINASEGANALKSGLASLINPTGKANDMLLSFGINAKEIVLQNKGDLKKTVIEFATALNMLDPLNRAQAIEQMFGKFQFARLSTLFANVTKEGTQASRVLDLAGASVQELAALSEKELGMTSESAMNKFKGAVENLKLALVPVGEEFLKAVTPIAEFITKILDRFNNLSDGTKKIIVTMTAVIAGLGPVFLMTFGLLANGIANIIKGFTLVKSVFNKTSQSTTTLGTQVEYMTLEQRNAAAVAASLDQVHKNLAQTFTSEATAVNSLTQAYQRAIAAQAAFMPTTAPIGRGPIKKRAKGKPAVVGGTGNQDSELALLMPGETVIPTAMSAKYGGLINAMISDKIPGYEVGKPKAGSPSIYGGQSLEYSGLGVFAPGNTSGSTLGMDRSFLMEGDRFLKSLTASAVGGGATLDNPTARLTAAATREYAEAVKTFMPRIVDTLRTTTIEMEQNGENISSIEDITKKAKPKLDKIFTEMTVQGGKAASSATALQKHLLFPSEAEMGGQFGETRVPGARRSSSGAIKSTMYRIKKSPFQSRVKTAYRNLFGANPEGSYAHMNESRMLGADVPLRGGALALPESERAPLAARVTAKGRSIREEFFGGIRKRRTASEQAAIRQSGAEDKREYVKGAESVDTKDPYLQKAEKEKAHMPLASKDGKDDAKAYVAARDKELTQSGRRRRVATRGQGPAPIGATPLPGATILPIVPPNPKDPSNKKTGRFGNLGGKLNSMGGGMGILGANMALSMAPDFAGKGIAQGGLAGANLGMMFGPYGMAAGAALGTVTSALTTLIAKQNEYAANTRSTFIPSSEVITLFGDKVLDTSTKITNFSASTSNLISGLGLLSPEIKAAVDAIAQLPEDNPLAVLVKNLSDTNMNLSSVTGSIRSQVATAISTGGLDPKNAEKYVQTLLVAANRTKDFSLVWKSVSKDVENAQVATTASLNKISQVAEKTGETFFYNVSGSISKGYKDLTSNQKILSDQMLNLFNVVGGGSLTFDQIKERMEGLRKSSIDAKTGVAALSASIYNSGNPDLIARFKLIESSFIAAGRGAELSADKIMLYNVAIEIANKQLGGLAAESDRLFGTGSSSVSNRAISTLDNILSSSTFAKDYEKLKDQIINPYKDYEDGAGKAKTASELYLDVLEREIKGLEAKRDAQKNANDESKRQIDLQMKMMDLANKATFAKASGNYLEAASLQQQAQNVQMEFNQETNLRKKDAEIAKLRFRADEIKAGAPLTKAESIKLAKSKKGKAMGGLIRKSEFAQGGLIRGSGTGTSDSIRATLGYAGGGSIRVSNGEYVVRASSVKDYGINTMNAVNNGTAAIGTNSGGTVYNINMPITSNNANAEGVANEVIRKLKLEVNKNNKTNKVGI
jgi:TP901 family phage tail tape measure protein